MQLHLVQSSSRSTRSLQTCLSRSIEGGAQSNSLVDTAADLALKTQPLRGTLSTVLSAADCFNPRPRMSGRRQSRYVDELFVVPNRCHPIIGSVAGLSVGGPLGLGAAAQGPERGTAGTRPLVSTQVLSNCRAVGDSRFYWARTSGATSEWLPPCRPIVTFFRGLVGAIPMEIRIRARRFSSRRKRGKMGAGTLTRCTTG
jgi:hypothetical protein